MSDFTIICIVGLPGSGKTWLAYKLAEEQPNTEVIDDLRYTEQLPEILDHNLIITDPFFCDIEVRKAAEMTMAEKYGVDITWIFYEKNPEKCLRNIWRRNDGRLVHRVFQDMLEIYKIPEGHEPRIIWDGENE